MRWGGVGWSGVERGGVSYTAPNYNVLDSGRILTNQLGRGSRPLLPSQEYEVQGTSRSSVLDRLGSHAGSVSEG